MKHYFIDNKFFIDLTSCSRPYKNLRDEYKIRSHEIFKNNNRNILCLNGGISSQAILHSFFEQRLPIKTAFLHLPGINENDFERIQLLDKKYNTKTIIIDIDILKIIDQIHDVSVKLDIPKKLHILYRKFLSFLPTGYNIVYSSQEPFVYVNQQSKNKYFYYGYYTDDISLMRSLESLDRSGEIVWFNNTPEIQASIVNDDVFDAAFYASEYFDGNCLSAPEKDLLSVDRYDYYIKPLIYSKYWKDELMYFPITDSIKNINLFGGNYNNIKTRGISIPFNEFKHHISNTNSVKKRFVENVSQHTESKILGREIDKYGNSVSIKYVDNVYCEETKPFFLEQIEELTAKNLRAETILPTAGSAIFAEIKGTIIGLVVFSFQSKKKEKLIWLIIGAVAQEYQQQGIYRILRNYLENIAKEKGYIGIASNIHIDNHIALISSQNQGATQKYNYMIKYIT